MYLQLQLMKLKATFFQFLLKRNGVIAITIVVFLLIVLFCVFFHARFVIDGFAGVLLFSVLGHLQVMFHENHLALLLLVVNMWACIDSML